MRLVVLLCAGTLLLTACGGDGDNYADLFNQSGSAGPSQPADAPYTPDYPVAEYEKENVEAFQKLRQIDPCAMVDLEAVKKAAGAPELDSIAPGELLSVCTVDAGKGELARTWSFKIDLGGIVGTEAPETIGDVPFQKFAPREGSCQYVTPVTKSHGMSLQVQWGGTAQAPAPACDVAKQYLTDTAARWKNPPKRAENKTTPALPLAGIDPCIAAKALLNGSDGRAKLGSPHRCSVGAPIKAGESKDKVDMTVDIQLSFDSDPVEQVKNNPTTFKSAQVKGKPASVMQSGRRCVISVQFSPDTLVKVDESKGDDPSRNQVIEVSSGTCEAATTAAETVVGRILEVKLPAPGQPASGALKLGDLNPPASWQEVGAPADPCTVIGWDAFPQEVRNPKNTAPTRRPPEKDSVFKTACRFESGGADVTVDKDKPATSSTKLMLALVVWGDDASGMSADPAKRPGSVAKQYGGKPGLELGGKDSQGNPECLGVVKTSKGYWGVSVTNAAFPNTPPCAISTSVMNALAAKTS